MSKDLLVIVFTCFLISTGFPVETSDTTTVNVPVASGEREAVDVQAATGGKAIVNVPEITSQSYYPLDLADLEKNVDVIVQAKVLQGAKNVFITPDDPYSWGYTQTQLELIKVFSGNVKAGDILTISEPYFLVETSTEIQVHHTENYNPSIPGQEYIFFLNSVDEERNPQYAGMYFPRGVEKGRYPVLSNSISSFAAPYSAENAGSPRINVDNYTNAELNLGELDSTEYRQYFKDVIEKYYNQVDMDVN